MKRDIAGEWGGRGAQRSGLVSRAVEGTWGAVGKNRDFGAGRPPVQTPRRRAQAAHTSPAAWGLGREGSGRAPSPAVRLPHRR